MASICNIIFNNLKKSNNNLESDIFNTLLSSCKNNILENDNNYFEKLLNEITSSYNENPEKKDIYEIVDLKSVESIESLIPNNKLIKMLIDSIMYFIIQILTIINLLLKFILQFITIDSNNNYIDYVNKSLL
jgi:hypothetical protein